jgi:hypothetical protein
MLSKGEDLKDEREKATWSTRITFNTRCSSLFFFMLSTMLKHGGGIAALLYEH